MPAPFNYRYGETNPIQVPYVSGSAVDVGDMVFLTAAGAVESAGNMTPGASLVASQEAFAAAFLGVSAQRYDGVNAAAIGIKDGNLLINTDGVYDMPCPAGTTAEVGALVTPNGNATTFVLDSQEVVTTTTAAAAIGVVVMAATNASVLRVQLFSNKIARTQF